MLNVFDDSFAELAVLNCNDVWNGDLFDFFIFYVNDKKGIFVLGKLYFFLPRPKTALRTFC